MRNQLRTITPWLAVDGARKAHDFYVRAFDAIPLACEPPTGRVALGLLRFGDTVVSVVDPIEQLGLRSPKNGGTCSIALDVADADALFARAVHLGATAMAKVAASFAGERHGLIVCPFGHRWILSTRTEDLTVDQVVDRFRRLGLMANEGPSSGS